MQIDQTATQWGLHRPVSRGAYTNTGPRVHRSSRGGIWRSGNARAFRLEHPDCEGAFLRQLAGLPAQDCSTDRLPIRPVAGWTVALLSIDGPRIWNQPITAARPRRNWRGPLSAPHFPFHPVPDLDRSTDCTTRARYTKSRAVTSSTSADLEFSRWKPFWRARINAFEPGTSGCWEPRSAHSQRPSSQHARIGSSPRSRWTQSFS